MIHDHWKKIILCNGECCNLFSLYNLLHVQDYGVGAHTTLHAFCWSDDGPAVSATDTKSSTSELSNEREHLALPDNHNQHASSSNDHETHDDCAATGYCLPHWV